jgi:S-ribosylhomocysteine lyase
MGCRTGLYFLTRNLDEEIALSIFLRACDYIIGYEGVILGAASSKECGNWLDHDLSGAKNICKTMKSVLNNWKKENMVYPI